MAVSTGKINTYRVRQLKRLVRPSGVSTTRIHENLGSHPSGDHLKANRLILSPNGYINSGAFYDRSPWEVLEFSFKNPFAYYEAGIIGSESIGELMELAQPLQGKRILNINSSSSLGGGVAELLNFEVPILRSLGIDLRWVVINGTPDFFAFTKSTHNGIQGKPIPASFEHQTGLYRRTLFDNSKLLDVSQADIVMVHDPQPLGLINHFDRNNGTKFIWRCHIDCSNPNPRVLEFLLRDIFLYDASIFSLDKFVKPEISEKIPVTLIPPAIDPLSTKNIDRRYIDSLYIIGPLFRKYGIDPKKPIVLQLSRFDPSKGWHYVLDVARRLKGQDIQTICVGPEVSGVSDDPEAVGIFNELKRATRDDDNIFIVELPTGDVEQNQKMVGSLFKFSDVVLQLSTEEGFGLTFTEANWINGVTVGSSAGGLSLQGGQFDPSDTGAISHRVLKLLNDKETRVKLSEANRNLVRDRFIFDRYIKELLLFFTDVLEERLQPGIVDYNGWMKMTA